VACLTWGCATVETPAPKLVVLGVAQDAGVPQAACTSANCEAARNDSRRSYRVASLLLAGADASLHLVDATPDLVPQLDVAIAVGQQLGRTEVPRRPVDGVLLTHGHMGHYLGLAHFGFEAAHTQGIRAYGTESMTSFLASNAPWNQLVRLHNVELEPVEPGATLALGGIKVTPLSVPHRGEYTDTVAYRFEGPTQTVLYIPDTDPWKRWASPPEPMFEGVDLALLDGTFYSGEELPGRDLSKIGHPFIVDTMDRFQSAVDAGELNVTFIHLNHSNPALDRKSAQARAIESRGYSVARRGDEIRL